MTLRYVRTLLIATGLCVGGIGAPGSTAAQTEGAPSPPATARGAAGPLKPLAYLAGHCWKGTFPRSSATDEHCFEWVFDGAYIRDRHVVVGQDTPYAGETLYGVEPTTGRLVFWYWNSGGEFTTGSVEPSGDEVIFPEELRTAKGIRKIRTVWRHIREDRFHVQTMEWKDGGWVEMFSMELIRQSRPPS